MGPAFVLPVVSECVSAVMSASSHYDVAIVGGGLSGLAAGIRCAQFFKRVAIVEAHSKLGGLNSYYHKQSREHLFSNGLHTVTNFNPTSRRWGLPLVLRNLGLSLDEVALYPANHPSRITTPEASLVFDNDPHTLEQSIAAAFPSDIDGYRQFVAAALEESTRAAASLDDAFAFLARYVQSSALRTAIALPVLSYGGYREETIDSRTFAILFRSLLLEGCGSPVDMRTFVETLQRRYEALGGQLLRRTAVARIVVDGARATSLELADGNVITAERVLSSAGLVETGRLCGAEWGRAGTISVYQWIGAYNRPLEAIGVRDTLHFVSRAPRFAWKIPGGRPFTDVLTYSAGDNYAFPTPGKAHLKISCFSRADEWRELTDEQYEAQKRRYRDELLAISEEYYPGLRESAPVVEDTFTPLTVEHYTRHPGGTIYGGVEKTFDGRTPVANLFIIGNDQGGMGIIGSMTSGIVVTNLNLVLSG